MTDLTLLQQKNAELFKIQCHKILAPCSEGRRGDENRLGYHQKIRQSLKDWK